MTDEFDKKADEITQGLEKLRVKEEPSDARKDRNLGERAFAEIIGGLIFGLLFGYGLDDYFDTTPIFLLVFVLLGLAGSVYNIYKAFDK